MFVLLLGHFHLVRVLEQCVALEQEGDLVGLTGTDCLAQRLDSVQILGGNFVQHEVIAQQIVIIVDFLHFIFVTQHEKG